MPGLLDLSIVTDQLLAILRSARTSTRLWIEETANPPGTAAAGPGVPAGDTTPTLPFDINFTGMAPDAARAAAGACKVSLYLFHVAPEPFHRNTYPADPRITDSKQRNIETRPRRIPQQPLALSLHYLLSAHSESYVEEQQAMSIAMKALHDHPNPRITLPVHSPDDPPFQSISLVLQTQTVDDVGRLWQAISTPLRMSAVYRVSVVFLEPEVDPRPLPKPVETFNVAAYPQFLISRALVAGAIVTVSGHHFDDPSLAVRLGGAPQTIVRTAPPPMPLVGNAYVASASSLTLRLPDGTRKDDLVRLGVAVDSDRLEAIFTIKATAAVP